VQHVDVTWVALECRMRQEASDEVYGTVNAIAADSQALSHKFPGDRPNWDMGESGERIVTVGVPMYSGPPIPLLLMVTLVEHDSGNIDAYKEQIAQAIAKTAGAVAGGLTSGATAVAQPIIDELARGLVDVATDVLGTADDPYNPASIRLEAGALGDPDRPRHHLQRPDDPRTADFTDVIVVAGTDEGGDRGEYAFYFDTSVSGSPDAQPTETVRGLAAHSGKVLDVANSSTENLAQIVQFDWHGGDNQRWRLEGVGEDLWRIVSVHSGKVLDVKDASLDNSAPIVQFDWHGGNNQRWRREDVGDGLSRIVSAHSGKVLDVSGASQDNSAPLLQFDWHGGLNQRWRMEPLLHVVPGVPAFPTAPIHPA
jgi:Ricin-type beta-trefoil lectin domain-like